MAQAVYTYLIYNNNNAEKENTDTTKNKENDEWLYLHIDPLISSYAFNFEKSCQSR